jgi:hypothetical protein
MSLILSRGGRVRSLLDHLHLFSSQEGRVNGGNKPSSESEIDFRIWCSVERNMFVRAIVEHIPKLAFAKANERLPSACGIAWFASSYCCMQKATNAYSKAGMTCRSVQGRFEHHALLRQLSINNAYLDLFVKRLIDRRNTRPATSRVCYSVQEASRILAKCSVTMLAKRDFVRV